jgi:hypothetical protein
MTTNSGAARHFFRLAQAASLLLWIGCQRDAVTVYRIPKETNQVLLPKLAGADRNASSDSRPEIRWAALPGRWQERPASSMRVASFAIEGTDGQKAEVSVTRSVELQISRRRVWTFGAVNLAWMPQTQRKLRGRKYRWRFDGNSLRPEGFKTSAAARILGAVPATRRIAWFFKMGGSRLVAQQKSAFSDFLKTLSFVEGGALPGSSISVRPEARRRLPELQPSPRGKSLPIGRSSRLTMVLAVFVVTADTGKAEVTVSAFPGDVGGLSQKI